MIVRIKQLIAFYRSSIWANIQSFFGVKGYNYRKWDSEFLREKIEEGIKPFLSEKGWEGNGLLFRKINHNETIHYLEFISGPSRISIGLVVEFTFLDKPRANLWELPYNTDIREGVPKEYGLEGGWPFPENRKQLENLYKKVKKSYSRECEPFFSKFDNWEKLFREVTPKSIIDEESLINHTTAIRQALLSAKILVRLEEYNKAEEMVNFGLSEVDGPNGAGLIPEFELLKQKIKRAIG